MNVKHGITHYLKHGKFHPSIRSRRILTRTLDVLRDDLRAEIPDISVGKEVILNETMRCLAVIWLTSLYVGKHGLFREDELKRGVLQLHPVMERALVSYEALICKNLERLGLDGRKADTLDPHKYMQDVAKRDGA